MGTVATVYIKNNTRNFCYLFVCKVIMIKANFRFYKQCSQAKTRLISKQAIFPQMLVSFCSSNIPLYIENNPVEKLCKVLEMELKTYTSVSSKFVFEKIKFKVLHYVQHDFICQCLEFSKDQASMLKSLFINYFILKYCHTFLIVI